MFLRPEWDNFVRVTSRRPWRWPGYALGLACLIQRRVANTLRLRRCAAEPHRGLKRWPAWLGAEAMPQSPQGEMNFPRYPDRVRQPLPSPIPQLRFAADDREGAFAMHRWGQCLVAALEGGAAPEAALREVLVWIRQAPPKTDAAWETYSACERVVNLAVMLAAHPQCREALTAEETALLAGFFSESAAWIHSRLEYYGFARTNNHILNNARALTVAGSVLGNTALVERGLLLFATMARLLFQPGGFLRERSSHYQLVVTGWLLDTVHFARPANMSPTAQSAVRELEGLAGKVGRVSSALVALTAGLDTYIGDISPDCHPIASVQRLLRLYPEHVAENAKSALADDDWMLICVGEHRLLTCALPAAYPLAYATHGHADLCSFVWSHAGRPVLVDAGRSDYLPGQRAALQCGSQGHNVMTVQGLPALVDTLLANGQWCPRPYAAATADLVANEQGFSLRHDGFARIPGVGKHVREVAIEAEGILVRDTLEGDGEVVLDFYWHFPPGILADETSPGRAIGQDFQVAIQLNEDSRNTEMQWSTYPYAAAYGEAREASMLHIKRSVSLPYTFETRMTVLPCAG